MVVGAPEPVLFRPLQYPPGSGTWVVGRNTGCLTRYVQEDGQPVRFMSLGEALEKASGLNVEKYGNTEYQDGFWRARSCLWGRVWYLERGVGDYLRGDDGSVRVFPSDHAAISALRLLS